MSIAGPSAAATVVPPGAGLPPDPAPEASAPASASDAWKDLLPEGDERPPPGTRTAAIVRWVLVGLMGLAAASAWIHHATAGGFEEVSRPRFHCPMHPTVVGEREDECPICGMDLVPVAAGAPEQPASPADGVPGLATVELTAERIRLAGLRTAVATREPLASALRTVGFVTANERGLFSVSVRFSGWIESLGAGETGRRVEKGEILATIFSPDSVNAQKAFLTRSRWADPPSDGSPPPPRGTDPGVEIARQARQRIELLGFAGKDLDALAASGQPTQLVHLRAPAAGHVAKKAALRGMYVQPGLELFQIADLSTVWVIADVYESDIGRVRAGQHAVLEVPAYPGERFPGEVAFVHPALSEGSRTLQARIELRNSGLKLRPGMYGDVTLDLGASQEIVVPAEALVDLGEAQYLFVSKGQGRFEPRRVRGGATGGGKVAVVEGLAEGERVVTSASFLLDSESRLRAALAGAGGR
jgi:Cu(I)/Ag(I) efflux system membrane fusion protein